MSRHLPPDPQTRSSRPAAALAAVLVALVSSLAPRPSHAERVGLGDLRLTTENDLLVTDQDDLYTFAIAFDLQRGPYTFSFRENAFTDRAAGVRFDESQLAVGRQLRAPGPWSVYAEAGVVRLGEGLFGERAQNAVHAAIGGEEVELPYAEPSLHVRVALAAGRFYPLTERLDVGPLVELEATPGLRSHVLLGAQTAWRPRRGVEVFLTAGGRLDDAANPALERHVLPAAPVARLGLVLRESVYVTWSYNDYGDGREHLALGYRVPTGGRTRSEGARAEPRGLAPATAPLGPPGTGHERPSPPRANPAGEPPRLTQR